MTPKGSRIAILVALVLAAMAACSPGIFGLPEAPEIRSLTLDRYEVDPDDTVTAVVSIKDAKDKSLTYEWSCAAGRFLPPLDQARALWKAPAVGGAYRLGVKVSNEDKSSSRTVDVTVRSFTLPAVRLLSPEDGARLVQYSTLAVAAEARHENGIARVDLLLNGSLRATLNGRADGRYDFTCALDAPSGPATVTVTAVANVTGRAASDSVTVSVEGIVLGRPARTQG